MGTLSQSECDTAIYSVIPAKGAARHGAAAAATVTTGMIDGCRL